MTIPVGELTSIGVVKETTFGVFPGAPTVFHGIEAFTPSVKNVGIPRGASRRRAGMSLPSTGPLDSSFSFRPESTPDTLGQLLAYGFGSQTTPSAALTSFFVNPSGSITGTGSAQSVNVTGSTAKFTNTSTAQISGGGNTETVNVTVVTGSALTINPVHNYTSSATITLLSPTAKMSTVQFGTLQSALPSFSLEFNRITDAIDYLGCCIDQVKFSLEPGKGLAVDLACVAYNHVKNASPTTPTFSVLDLLAMESAGTISTLNGATIGGPTSAPAVLKWDVTLNNSLDKNYRGAGSGRFVYGFPVGQRKVSGSLTLGFETEAAQLLFWGSSSTGPGSIIAGVPITLTVGCQDYADTTNTLSYSITINLPNCFITAADVANKTSGYLMQPVTFTAAESPAVGNNDITATLVNLATTVY